MTKKRFIFQFMKEYTLRDLLKIKNGRDHKNLAEGPYPVYGSGGIMRYVDSFLYDKPSILLPRKGSLTNIQFCEVPFWTVDTTYYTEIDETLCDPYYLYCYLTLLDLSSFDTGSAVPSMTFDSYYQQKVILPSLAVQKEVAQHIRNIDKKISINEQINRNLEALAREIYDYWFVQFDFPDKNGKPYKSSGGRMVWNDQLKREIPAGWEVSNLLDKNIYNSDYTANGSFKDLADNVKYNEGEPYAMIVRIVDFNDDFDESKFVRINKHAYDYLETCRLHGGEIIICNVGNAGATYRCPFMDLPMSLGPNGIMVNNDFYNHYLFMHFSGSIGQQQIRSISSGSIQMKFNKTNFRLLPTIFPPDNIIEEFNRLFNPIEEKKNICWTESRELRKQRDFLLPLLMNGQAKVKA